MYCSFGGDVNFMQCLFLFIVFLFVPGKLRAHFFIWVDSTIFCRILCFPHANMFGFRHRLGLCGSSIVFVGSWLQMESCVKTLPHTKLFTDLGNQCPWFINGRQKVMGPELKSVLKSLLSSVGCFLVLGTVAIPSFVKRTGQWSSSEGEWLSLSKATGV